MGSATTGVETRAGGRNLELVEKKSKEYDSVVPTLAQSAR